MLLTVGCGLRRPFWRGGDLLVFLEIERVSKRLLKSYSAEAIAIGLEAIATRSYKKTRKLSCY